VDWVIGNGALWRTRAIRAIGLFDEGYFAYHDDVDWCTRARQAGYRVLYLGTAAILHQGGGSSDPTAGPAFPCPYFLGRNGVRFVRQYANCRESSRFAVLCSGAAAGRLLRAALFRSMVWNPSKVCLGKELWRHEKLFLWGLADGLRNWPVPFERLGLPGCIIGSGGPSLINNERPATERQHSESTR